MKLDTWGKRAGAVASILAGVAGVWGAFQFVDRRVVEMPASLDEHMADWAAFGADEGAFRSSIQAQLDSAFTHAEGDRHAIRNSLAWLIWKEQRDACRQERMAAGLDRETALRVCETEHPIPGSQP